MLLERSPLERHLAQIVAINMPGHGGDEAENPSGGETESPEPEREPVAEPAADPA